MAFINTQVDLDELPDFRQIKTTQVERQYANVCTAIGVAIFAPLTLGLLLGGLLAHGQAQIVLLFLSAGAFALGSLISVYTFNYCTRVRYAIRTHDIIVRKGIFFFSETIQPLVRVQHVELKRGPVEKHSGLASLKIFSAGLGKETFTLPGLLLADAERVRTHVLGYNE
jgi:membrane protein YdbS with pleckstrin-like domain